MKFKLYKLVLQNTYDEVILQQGQSSILFVAFKDTSNKKDPLNYFYSCAPIGSKYEWIAPRRENGRFYQFMLAPKRAHLTHDTRILSVAFVNRLCIKQLIEYKVIENVIVQVSLIKN